VIPGINPAKQGYYEDFNMFRYASVLAAMVALCLTGTSEAKGGAGGGRGGRGMARSSGMKGGFKAPSRKAGRGREYHRGRGYGYRGYRGYGYGYRRYHDYRGYGYRHGYRGHGYQGDLGFAAGDNDDDFGNDTAVGNDGGDRGGYRHGYRHRHHRGHRIHPLGHGSRGGKR
jgi:hypothetical protein